MNKLFYSMLVFCDFDENTILWFNIVTIICYYVINFAWNRLFHLCRYNNDHKPENKTQFFTTFDFVSFSNYFISNGMSFFYWSALFLANIISWISIFLSWMVDQIHEIWENNLKSLSEHPVTNHRCVFKSQVFSSFDPRWRTEVKFEG